MCRRSLVRSLVAVAAASLALGGSARAQPPADLTLEFVAGSFNSPLAIRNAGDGSGRLFIVEQGGLIRIIDATGAVLPTPFLDLTTPVLSGGEQGLLGLAFHPDYSTNGFFYVNYTRSGDPQDQTVVERYEVSDGDANVADPMSGTEIIVINQTYDNHNGGDIHFGLDGYLYIGMGDGGGNETSQDLTTLLGKMLRIDVDSGSPYAIPPDNPFVMTRGVAALPEIWASGLRNPYRWSFDRMTGDMMIGDVGESEWEEVSFQPASSLGGENYGWPCREGAHDFSPIAPGCDGATLVDPVLEYSSDGNGNCSVISGFVYRGSIPGFDGTYVYNDWCTGLTWFATQTALGVWESTLWDDLPDFSIVGYGEDEDGELYMARGEEILRFALPSMIFADGFESGNTSRWANGR